jgi:tetratricopeptide (TPR) repeat protein
VPENPRLEELRRRVQADPASIAFAALAEEFRRTGRFAEAIETCRMGLQRHPAYGRALIEIGDYDAAREELETVLRSAPENLAATRGLEQIDERLGHSTEMHPDLHEIAREPIRLATERPPAPPPVEQPPAIDLMPANQAAPPAPEPEAIVDEPADAAAAREPFDIFGAALQAPGPPPAPPPAPIPIMAFEPSTIAFEAPAEPAERAPDPHVAAMLSRLERFLGAIESARHA